MRPTSPSLTPHLRRTPAQSEPSAGRRRRRSAARVAGRAAAAVVLLLSAVTACEPDASPPPPAGTASPTPGSGLPRPVDPAQPPPQPSPSAPDDRIPVAPDRDLRELARRFLLRGEDPPALTFGTVGADRVGEADEFWLMDLRVTEAYRTEAVLRVVTPHAAWYLERGADVPDATVAAIARAFEERVYPEALAAFLGGEDAARALGFPPQITMLVARLRGAAGYFGGVDFQPASVYRYSNQRPMLYLDHHSIRGEERESVALLAHEFQHLVHWHADPNEETWVNEGLAELAPYLLGISVPLSTPPRDLAAALLVRWGELSTGIGRYYDAALLFFRSLLQHHGGVALLPMLVSDPRDGIEGVEASLAASGSEAGFDEVFQDWSVANLLGDAGGVLGYGAAEQVQPVTPKRSLRVGASLSASVAPYATEYVRLVLSDGPTTLRFDGDARVPLIPAPAPGGDGCWWGNLGDAIHSRLEREIDLGGVTSATLRFDAWYDIEDHWDYAYVTASRDGGATWEALPGLRTSSDNPVGAAYGPGFTGASDGWVREAVDLTPFVGARVRLAFEYVTDDSFNSDGICIDRIAVPEVGFFDAGEGDGWLAEGFVRTATTLVQRFGVRLVEELPDGGVRVTDVRLGPDNTGVVTLPAAEGVERATLVVSSLARHVRAPASFRLTLDEGDG